MASQSTETRDRPLEYHTILANERRKLAIEALQSANRGLHLKELSERVAAAEAVESPPPERLRNSVYISLLQTHLPRLKDANIIEHDEDSNVIQLKTAPGGPDVVAETVPRFGLAWSEVYLGIAVLGLGTVSGSWLGTPGIGALQPAIWAALFLLGLLATAAYRMEKQGSSVVSRLGKDP